MTTISSMLVVSGSAAARRIARATSSGRSIRERSSSVPPARSQKGVSTAPGMIVVTCTPSRRTSSATTAASARTPAFDAEYAALWANGRVAAIEAPRDTRGAFAVTSRERNARSGFDERARGRGTDPAGGAGDERPSLLQGTHPLPPLWRRGYAPSRPPQPRHREGPAYAKAERGVS